MPRIEWKSHKDFRTCAERPPRLLTANACKRLLDKKHHGLEGEERSGDVDREP